MKIEFKVSISLRRGKKRDVVESEEQFEHRDTDSTTERGDDIPPGAFLPVPEPDESRKHRRVGF